ncbi:MAG: radical SAM protein [Bdellovibrionales bacterium]|nr:radical SAM protein [Bdellovibrionales bacterium]
MNSTSNNNQTLLLPEPPFESFTYPFFDLSPSVDGTKLVEAYLNSTPSSSRENAAIYVHIPFCDTICKFCPFVKSVGTADRIEAYLAALFKHIEMASLYPWSQRQVFRSVYIGGGTPSVLSIEQIENLTSRLRESFSIAQNAEWSIEVEAKSSPTDKLKGIRDLGYSRVSFGLQTFNHEIRERFNLTANRHQIDQLISDLSELFPKNNCDLIVGFPGQSLDSSLEDVEILDKSGIGSVSVYPLDYTMIAPNIHSSMSKGELPPPPSYREQMDNFFAVRQLLKTKFREDNIYSYGKGSAEACKFMFEHVYGSYYNTYLGLGCSSYSNFKGLMFQNQCSEQQYVNSIMNGELPIQAASAYNAYEKRLVFFPKHLSYDLGEYRSLGLNHIYDQKLDTLEQFGYVKIDRNSMKLTTKGELDYAGIMVYLFSDLQHRLYNRICKKLPSYSPTQLKKARPRQSKLYGTKLAMVPQ